MCDLPGLLHSPPVSIATEFHSDPALVHSTASEVGYLRIAAALLSMADDTMDRLVEIPPATVMGSSRALSEDEGEHSESFLEPLPYDERLLKKLQYRWMATKMTYDGQEARQEWVARHRPPGLDQEDCWLTFEALRSLVRRVLQITPVEVSEAEIELFFDALDLDMTGATSFYKLCGLLEANSQLDRFRPRSSIIGSQYSQPKRSHSRKRRPKSAGNRVSFQQAVPWRAPGPRDKGWPSLPPT